MFNKSVVCRDGFTMSVQANHGSYCSPRDDLGPYVSVEVGYPTMVDQLLLPYAENKEEPTQTVYGWVPVHKIVEIILSHGGMVDGELPTSPVFVSVDPKFGIKKNENV